MSVKKANSNFSIEPVDEFQKQHLQKAEEVRREIYKNMSAEDKLREVGRLWFTAVELKKSHLRDIYPGWSEEKIQQKVRDWMMYAST